MPNGTYGGVRGRKTKVGEKPFRFPPTRLPAGELLQHSEDCVQGGNGVCNTLSLLCNT